MSFRYMPKEAAGLPRGFMLLKVMPIQRFHRVQAFIDSDYLLSLYELIGHVQASKNLVLILTPGCYARGSKHATLCS